MVDVHVDIQVKIKSNVEKLCCVARTNPIIIISTTLMPDFRQDITKELSMASAMHLMKKMEINSPVKGVGGLVLDGAVGFGASYAMGQAYHRYNDKWYGKNAPRLAAVIGKLGAVGLSLLSGGHQTFVGSMANSVGQAGINAIGLEMGLRHARAKTGKKAVLVPSDTNVKAISGASEMSSIGELGKAAPGRGLTWDQIEELAQGR